MNEKIRELLLKYQKELSDLNMGPERQEDYIGIPGVKGISDDTDQMKHVSWMINEMLNEDVDWSDRKTNRWRWLGFVQGVLWGTKMRGILELRDESRHLYDD